MHPAPLAPHQARCDNCRGKGAGTQATPYGFAYRQCGRCRGTGRCSRFLKAAREGRLGMPLITVHSPGYRGRYPGAWN